MARTTYLAVKVSYVSGCCKKKTIEKQVLGSGNKTMQAGHQGRQADKAVRMTGQQGLLALFCLRY
jgi:hypothetical protein